MVPMIPRWIMYPTCSSCATFKVYFDGGIGQIQEKQDREMVAQPHWERAVSALTASLIPPSKSIGGNMKEKTNLYPMGWRCRLGLHSFTDKPYNRTYIECYRCKSVLPGYKRVFKVEPNVNEQGHWNCAYTLEGK